MGRALLGVGFLATLGFIAAGVMAYVAPDRAALGGHVLVGLVACFLLLFSHSWVMFYLIGTGKAVKDAVAEHDLPSDWVERTKDFKNRSYPALTLATALAMATFILGGGVDTGVLPGWVHWGLFYATLAAQARALWLEHRVLGENRELLAEVDRRLRRAARI